MNKAARVIEFPAHRRRPESLLTLHELMELFGYSERWWRYRIAEDAPTVRWGGRHMFRASEIETWMEARSDGT